MPSLRIASCPAVSLQAVADGDCRPTKKEGKEEEEKEEEEKMIKEGVTVRHFLDPLGFSGI